MRSFFTRTPALTPPGDRRAAPVPSRARDRLLPHWHESSLELQRGLDVIEHFDEEAGHEQPTR